ncbi:TetR family transcriptional regulator [Clavibacter michiganensis subsp. phaseoli]|uniref:TetR family transcriptional regulator n=1 Tax=Clavibacter phaseoli TaxID=1734031 RepID=A0A8I0S640_9MICO|nr:TetR family transcriptional regulator [Clavibacter phaseoli]MBF4629631.1 TetR family transcriptional regulator [Clavibacter phaseoli]
MPRGDSAETRDRLLRAGLSEFSSHGLAGARVERVAASGGVSKQGIYNYFGGKDGLFLAVIDVFVVGPLDSLAFDPLDLAAYAGRLFDLLEENPDVARLIAWSEVGTPTPGPDALRPTIARRAELIRDAQAAGRLSRELDPLDTLLAVHALPMAWHLHPGRPTAVSAATGRSRREASVEAARHFTLEVSVLRR